jgi:uncharacterized protein (TIGR00369 family)
MGLLAADENVATIEMKVNFIKPVTDGEITAEGRILHKGRNTCVGEAVVRDAEGRRVAHALATYAVLRGDVDPTTD